MEQDETVTAKGRVRVTSKNPERTGGSKGNMAEWLRRLSVKQLRK